MAEFRIRRQPEQIARDVHPSDFFGMSVSAGDVGDYSVVHKFGKNGAVGAASFVPISIGGIYRTPTAATALEIVSASANDNASGSGAREVTIEGLDSNFELLTQTVVPNGITAVALDTDLTRVFRAYVSQSGTYADVSTGSHGGALTIRAAGGGDTWLTIDATDYPRGQTEIGAYTIPAGYRGFVSSLFANVDASQESSVIFMQRPNADTVAAPYDGAMRLIIEVGSFTGERTLKPKTPLGPFVGPCDLIFCGQASAGTADIDVDFEILLEKL